MNHCPTQPPEKNNENPAFSKPNTDLKKYSTMKEHEDFEGLPMEFHALHILHGTIVSDVAIRQATQVQPKKQAR
jgi:hypothetical protein